MRRTYRRAGLVATVIVAVSGCASMGAENVGTVVGAAVGAAVGAKVADDDNRVMGAAVGAVLGGLVGHKIGTNMDGRDRRHTAAALESSPAHRTSTWTNPDTGYGYSVTPTRTFTNAAGSPCRDFTIVQTASQERGKQETSSTACRDSGGVWKTG